MPNIHTSVSWRGLNDGVSRFQDAVSLSALYHSQTDSVLHAATGIEELAFSH